jgi:cytochrome P450
VQAEIDGRRLNDDEIIGICFMLFTGGLDTVASTIGFQFHYLAEHPELQERLKAHPELITRIVEELLRAFSVVVIHRVATQDTEIAGVKIAKGDWLSIPTALASMDPLDARGAVGVDPDRRVVRHMAFGMHLARREMSIAFEEWGKRLPVFEIPRGSAPRFKGGGVFLVDQLPLTWAR